MACDEARPWRSSRLSRHGPCAPCWGPPLGGVNAGVRQAPGAPCWDSVYLHLLLAWHVLLQHSVLVLQTAFLALQVWQARAGAVTSRVLTGQMQERPSVPALGGDPGHVRQPTPFV